MCCGVVHVCLEIFVVWHRILMYIHCTIRPPLYIEFTCGGRDSRERHSVSSTLDAGRGGDLISDVTVQVL